MTRNNILIILMMLLVASRVMAMGYLSLLKNRKDRLALAWYDHVKRNQELTGHPGPTSIDEWPGIGDTLRETKLWKRISTRLHIAFLATATLLLICAVFFTD